MSTHPSDNLCETRFAAHNDQTAVSAEGTNVQGHEFPTSQQSDAPLPRPKRRARRARADRGLPPDEELAKLASAYLTRQRKHWSEIVQAGLLSEPSDEVIRHMVADFKERHRTGKVDAATVRGFLKFAPKLGGNYDRYSCDNSSPMSIIDQMTNVLDKAQAENYFIPWAYLFCDYSVTGLDPARQGYTSYKALLGDRNQPIAATFIDDFTRASRDELEWWKLANLSKRLKKGMFGASDGFNLDSPDWDVKVTIYGLVLRLFVHDCPMDTSKSTRIIEECLLGYIGDFILTEAVINGLVEKGNAFLEQEARKPRVDTEPMRGKVRDYRDRIKKLVKKIEKEADEELCEGYHTRIKELQREVNRLNGEVREAEAHNQEPPTPLDVDRANVYLADLRDLLNQGIPMAAEAIRTLTGPIKVRQEKVPGKRGARWIASFRPDLLGLLRKTARERGYPDVPALATISAEMQPIEVVIEKVPKYERLAPLFKQMHDNGASVESIAHVHGMSWQYADQILKFAETGQRPKWKNHTRTGKGLNPTKYLGIAAKVTTMRDQEKMSFVKIAAELGVSEPTARRAYDHTHPETVRQAAERGDVIHRGKSSPLGEQVRLEIRRLLDAGENASVLSDCRVP